MKSGKKEKSKLTCSPVGRRAFEKAMRSKLLAVAPSAVKKKCFSGKEPRCTVRGILLQLYIDAKVSTNPEKSSVKNKIKDPSSGGSSTQEVVNTINSWSLSPTRAEELDARVDEPDILSGLTKISSAFQLTKHGKRELDREIVDNQLNHIPSLEKIDDFVVYVKAMLEGYVKAKGSKDHKEDKTENKNKEEKTREVPSARKRKGQRERQRKANRRKDT